MTTTSRPLVDLLDALARDGECQYVPDLHTGPDAFEDEPLAERRARVDAAKAICADCPVRQVCLEYALRIRPAHGVWAGHTARELADAIRAARQAQQVEEVA